MRIAIWHNLSSGGAKRALYHHAKGLLERGHTLEAWCPPTADQTYLPLGDMLREHVVPLDWQSVKSRIRSAQGAADYLSNNRLLNAMDEHCRQCAGEIARGDFDLLFANACMFLHAAPIGRYISIPKVLYLPEPNRKLYEAAPFLWWVGPLSEKNGWGVLRRWQYFLGDLFRTRGYRALAREEYRNVNAFDTILVNSLFSRETMLRTYGLEAKVCYLGVDTELFIDRKQVREDFVIGIGTVYRGKDIRFVLESLANTQKPTPRLMWVGNIVDSTYLEELQDQAEFFGVQFEAKVRIEDSELVNLLNRALAMVYAPRLEPFGIAPLEANACGLPVITVAEGGVRETVIDGVNGLLVEHDPRAMARAVDCLRRNPGYARELGENGRQLMVEKWTWGAAIDRLEKRFAESIDEAH